MDLTVQLLEILTDTTLLARIAIILTAPVFMELQMDRAVFMEQSVRALRTQATPGLARLAHALMVKQHMFVLIPNAI